MTDEELKHMVSDEEILSAIYKLIMTREDRIAMLSWLKGVTT